MERKKHNFHPPKLSIENTYVVPNLSTTTRPPLVVVIINGPKAILLAY
jgi:hypothetical protein